MPRRSAQPKAPRIKASLTAKVQGPALRASLRRRQTAANGTEAAYDPSVPMALQALGQPKRAAKPAVRVGDTARSPFILDLARAPEAHALLAVESAPVSAPNFLAAFTTLPTWESTEHDLALLPDELAGQVAEEADAYARALPLGRPLRLLFRRLPKAEPTAARVLSAALRPEPVGKPLAVAELAAAHASAPQAVAPAPVSALAFDLPEAEDGETAESPIVRFERNRVVMEAETGEETVVAHLPLWQRLRLPALPSFSFPAMPAVLPLGWQRAMATFVLLAFAFVLPIHALALVGGARETRASAEEAGRQALGSLQQAAGASVDRDAASARAGFDRAAERFGAARASVADFSGTVALVAANLPGGSTVRAGVELAAAGEALSRAGTRLADGFLAMEASRGSTTDRLNILSDYARSALPLLEEASAHVAKVRPEAVPEPHRETFALLQARLPEALDGLRAFTATSDALVDMLGGNGTRRYLAVFQNDTEIRPTGGFMGSFAELTVRNGDIVHMDVPGGGTYDVRGAFRRFFISPDPLRLLSARWEFQDANWFPDFPTSARKILSFYAASGGPTVDGVVAVNASYVADLLSMLGEIDMPDYDRVITGENFIGEAQKIVELEYDREENKPKQFIGDLAPEVLERAKALSGADFLGLLEHVSDGLASRDIQLYFPDERLQRVVADLGWDGAIRWTDGDYLMVVDTNLGGGKTDGVITQDVDMLVNVAADGSVTNTVTVTRTHHGSPDDLFSGANNVNFLRLYVPKGSRLLHASGFTPPPDHLFEEPEPDWEVDDDVFYAKDSEYRDAGSGTVIYEESGKTVFGNWTQTRPGARSSVTFTYRLPFAVAPKDDGNAYDTVKRWLRLPQSARYTLTVQKQSGIQDRTTRVRLETPGTLEPVWTSEDPRALTFTNARDGFFGALFRLQEP